MVNVSITVPAYPTAGVTSFEVEEATIFGLVQRLDTSTVGTFPTYTTTYTVPVEEPTAPLRARWVLSGTATAWFPPTTVAVTPTAEVQERLVGAVIQKATRILMLSKASLGSWGELNEFGVATVRADHEIQELLYGLRFTNWNVDLVTLVTTDMVIRVGMQTEPSTFPSDRLPDVQRAIESAVSWVASYLLEGTNLA